MNGGRSPIGILDPTMSRALRHLVVLAVALAQLWAGCPRAATICVEVCDHDGAAEAVRHAHDHCHASLPAPGPAHSECRCCVHLPGATPSQVAPRKVTTERLSPLAAPAPPDVRLLPVPRARATAAHGHDASGAAHLHVIRTVRLLV
jgi:hypothetical protein